MQLLTMETPIRIYKAGHICAVGRFFHAESSYCTDNYAGIRRKFTHPFFLCTSASQMTNPRMPDCKILISPKNQSHWKFITLWISDYFYFPACDFDMNELSRIKLAWEQKCDPAGKTFTPIIRYGRIKKYDERITDKLPTHWLNELSTFTQNHA